MNRDERIEKLLEDLEKILGGSIDGLIMKNEEQERYISFIATVVKQCKNKGIQIDIDQKERSQEILNYAVDKVNKEYNLSHNFTLEIFDKELDNILLRLGEQKYEKALLQLDTIVESNIKVPTDSILKFIREIMGKYNDNILTNFRSFLAVLIDDENEDVFDSIFGKSEIDDKTKLFIKETVENLISLANLGNFFNTINNRKVEIKKLRDKLRIDEVEKEHPEFIMSLNEIINNSDGYKLYFHGSQSCADSEKIMENGLFMQYGEINRTAKTDLNVADILDYGYGHDRVGKNSVVIIAAPLGVSPVEINNNLEYTVGSTGQGMEQGEFKAKYVIPSKYILGHVDKDNFVVMYNKNFKGKNQDIHGQSL